MESQTQEGAIGDAGGSLQQRSKDKQEKSAQLQHHPYCSQQQQQHVHKEQKLRKSPIFLRDNKKYVLEVVKQCGEELCFASERLRGEPDVVKAACEQSGQALQYATDTAKQSKEVVMTACRQNGHALKYACRTLQDDEEVVTVACQNGKRALRFASQRLKSSKDIVLLALRCGNKQATLYYASEDLKQDRDCLIAAGLWEEDYHSQKSWMARVQNSEDGLILRFATLELRNDKDLVCLACEQNGLALQHASTSLQDDEDVVKAACQENGKALRFASSRLRNKKSIVLQACQQTWRALEYASKPMQIDKDVVLVVCGSYGKHLEHAPSSLRDDKDVALAACRNNGEAIVYASERLRSDKGVVMTAVSSDALLLKYALGGLNQDSDCLIAAGIWDEQYRQSHNAISRLNLGQDVPLDVNHADKKTKIVLSTRFSLDPTSKSQATHFTTILKNHDYIQKSDRFLVYSPNAFDKCSCDPNWTTFDWPCRGTFESCQFVDASLKTGAPKKESCWRYSFRYQLQEAKRTNGFMIQLAEAAEEYLRLPQNNDDDGDEEEEDDETMPQSLGDGQTIEKEMAADLQLKVFRVYAPIEIRRNVHHVEVDLTLGDIDKVVSAVQNWYNEDCTDMTECNIRFTREIYEPRSGSSVRTKRL